MTASIPGMLVGQPTEFCPPAYRLQKEDAQDRNILYLVAQGWTDRKIAAELGVTTQKISYTRKQPWFIEALVKLLHENGNPAIERRLQTLTMEMLELGANLARNADSESVQATAVFSILKLARGDKVVVEDNRENAGELKAKREQLEKELRELRGESVSNVRIEFNDEQPRDT